MNMYKETVSENEAWAARRDVRNHVCQKPDRCRNRPRISCRQCVAAQGVYEATLNCNRHRYDTRLNDAAYNYPGGYDAPRPEGPAVSAYQSRCEDEREAIRIPGIRTPARVA